MADSVTKSDLTNLEKRLDKRFEKIDKNIDDLTALMSNFANDMYGRFDAVDKRFERVDDKFDKLLNTIDGFVKRIDNYETEQAARDHKIERLERWIQEIAAKTDTELT